MYTEIIKIIEGGISKDKEKVISYSKLLSENVRKDGNEKFANKILNTIEKKSTHPVYLDSFINKPLDQESKLDMVEVSMPSVINDDLVFSSFIEEKIQDFILSLQYRNKLEKMGVNLTTSLLLYGAPGCGKTSIAKYISNLTDLPLITARLDTLVSSLLGNTAKNMRKIFDYAAQRPCILFLDEFDAIAKARDDKHELGELKRVVNSLLQNIDEFNQESILIAATNHQELLDPAIWRRFSTIIEVEKPTSVEISKLIQVHLREIKNDILNQPKKLKQLSEVLGGLSPSDIRTISNNVIKKYVICNHAEVLFREYINELYYFKNHNSANINKHVEFLNANGVTQNEIVSMLNVSARQVRNILNNY